MSDERVKIIAAAITPATAGYLEAIGTKVNFERSTLVRMGLKMLSGLSAAELRTLAIDCYSEGVAAKQDGEASETTGA